MNLGCPHSLFARAPPSFPRAPPSLLPSLPPEPRGPSLPPSSPPSLPLILLKLYNVLAGYPASLGRKGVRKGGGEGREVWMGGREGGREEGGGREGGREGEGARGPSEGANQTANIT